ncbi:MAG: transketolase [Planctomycetota bacterium]|jgi:transketolase
MRDVRFPHPELPQEDRAKLADLARLCRGDILKMTTIAGSGHPGGSMSSIEMYLLVAYFAKLDPARPRWDERDRLVTSHGHTAAGAFSTLGRLGFFDVDQAVATFRLHGSPFEGHVERTVPGVEWCSGNLGQGLSAACGMALSARLRGVDSHAFCIMGDGEHQKGQIAEARRFASKFKLGNLTAFIDLNGLQISGKTDDVMPVDVAAEYAADGWVVEELDGHDLGALYAAVKRSIESTDAPTAIVARTVMGKGVSFMENKHGYHGKPLTEDELAKALAELGLENDLARLKAIRSEGHEKAASCAVPPAPPALEVNTGSPRDYGTDAKHDGRGAFGAALADLARANPGLPMAVFDCDLASSVRTNKFAEARPEGFIQSGIQEHHTAACAGAVSTDPVLTWWADFGVFGVCETYNQHRLNDINDAQLKTVCTHCGLDVGEDGKTHQCIDYVGAFANLYGYKVLTPADANQADRAVRFMAREPGSFFLATGRRKLPVIAMENGAPAFGGGYEFRYGKADLVRAGSKANAAAVLAMGQTAVEAVKASDALAGDGIDVQVWVVSSPLETDLAALRAAASTGAIVTVEDHHVRTGLAAQVSRALAEQGLAVSLKALGVTGFACSGEPASLYAQMGIDSDGIAAAVREVVAAKPAAAPAKAAKKAKKKPAKKAKKSKKKTKKKAKKAKKKSRR